MGHARFLHGLLKLGHPKYGEFAHIWSNLIWAARLWREPAPLLRHQQSNWRTSWVCRSIVDARAVYLLSHFGSIESVTVAHYKMHIFTQFCRGRNRFFNSWVVRSYFSNSGRIFSDFCSPRLAKIWKYSTLVWEIWSHDPLVEEPLCLHIHWIRSETGLRGCPIFF